MFYIVTSIIFFTISLCFILLRKKINSKFLNNLYNKLKTFITKYYKFLIFVLFALTFFTSTYKLGEVPYGLHVDEAGMAYDAISISQYGVDRYLNKLPVYLINYGRRTKCYVYVSYCPIN